MVETLKLSENMQEARRKNDPIESSPYQETEQEAHRWNTGHGRFASNMSDRHVLAPTEPFKPVVGREIYMCRCCTQWQEFLGPKHAKMRKIECLYMYQFQDINEFNGDHDYPARKIQPALPQNHVHALDKAENLPCEETEGEVRAYPAAGDGEQHDLQEERKQRELDQTVPYQEKSTTSEKVDSAIDGHVRTSSMLNGRNGDSDMSAVSGAVVQHLGLDGRHPLDSIPKQASNKNVKKRQRNRKKRNMEPEPHLWLFSYQLRLFLSIYNWWQNWRPSSSAGARNNAAMNCRKTNPACPVSSRRVKKTRRKRSSSLNQMTEIPQLKSPVTYVVMQNVYPVYKFPKRGASSNDFTSLMMKGASVCRPGSGSGGQIEGSSVHGITDVLSAVSSLLTDAFFSATGKLWSAVVDTGSAMLTPIVNRLQPSVRMQHKMSRLAWFLIAYVVVWGEDEASEMADPGQVQQGGHHEMMNFLDMLNILARLPPGTCVATPSGVIMNGNGLQPVNGHYRESAEFARLNMLGRGGYGVVLSCRDQTTNKLFAMKLIHLQNFDRREVEVPLGLQSRHVIDIYGIVVDGSAVKIFMELADAKAFRL